LVKKEAEKASIKEEMLAQGEIQAKKKD